MLDWRDVFEASPDLVLAKDLEGRYLAANPAFCSLVGIPHSLLLGMRDTDVSDDEVARMTQMARMRLIETGEPIEIDLDLLHVTDRVRRIYNAVLTPVRTDGRITGIAYFGRDITERVLLEKKLRDAQMAADEASQASSRFLAVASHDLRQPLQGALLFGAALPEPVEPRGQAVVAQLRGSLEILRTLLDSLFDMARLETGSLNPSIGEISLASMMADLLSAWEPQARAKGLSLSIASCDVVVRSDPVLLGRLLRNLIENAIRYTEHGSVTLSCSSSPGVLHIDIADTGPGIAEDKVQSIWSAFTRLEGDRHKADGLGIGLSIVRRIARLLEHPLTVRSRLGEGTVFTLSIPLSLSPEEGSRYGSDGVTPIPPGLRILVIEDDGMVLLSLKTLLEAWRADVTTARSAAEGLALVRQGLHPDMMLTDWYLSGGFDGASAVRTVRQALGQNLPAVIITGHSGPDPAVSASAAGIRLVRKPIPATVLAELIDGMLRGRNPGGT